MKRRSARRKKLDAVRNDLESAVLRVQGLEYQRTHLQAERAQQDNQIAALRRQLQEFTGVTRKWTQSGSVYRVEFNVGGFEWKMSKPDVRDQMLANWASRVKREINRLVDEKN